MSSQFVPITALCPRGEKRFQRVLCYGCSFIRRQFLNLDGTKCHGHNNCNQKGKEGGNGTDRIRTWPGQNVWKAHAWVCCRWELFVCWEKRATTNKLIREWVAVITVVTYVCTVHADAQHKKSRLKNRFDGANGQTVCVDGRHRYERYVYNNVYDEWLCNRRWFL